MGGPIANPLKALEFDSSQNDHRGVAKEEEDKLGNYNYTQMLLMQDRQLENISGRGVN